MIKLTKIGLVVLATFGLVWWPFLQDLDQVQQVVGRIFPLNRGLFEDKVSNFWCALNVALKLKANYDQDKLALTSAALTLIAVLPCNLALFWRPSKVQFVATLLNTALAFFLFSYQVHEKSILLVAFPALMCLCGGVFKGRYSQLILTWFLGMSTFSMFPLLQKDGLCLAFLALQVIFVTMCHYWGFFEFVENNQAENIGYPINIL
jgi:alpha-1,3-glucosyltransferase